MPDSQRLESVEEFRQSAIALLQSAGRSVSLMTYCLDSRVYNSEELCAALREFLLANRGTHARILIHSPDKAMGTTRFVELCRRLSSFVELRVLADHDRDCQEERLIADEKGYLYKAFPDDLYSIYDPEDGQNSRAHLKQFNELWDVAPPASSMRNLML